MKVHSNLKEYFGNKAIFENDTQRGIFLIGVWADKINIKIKHQGYTLDEVKSLFDGKSDFPNFKKEISKFLESKAEINFDEVNFAFTLGRNLSKNFNVEKNTIWVIEPEVEEVDKKMIDIISDII